VHCIEWLHVEALSDCVSLWISLVTLGVCRHLDGLEQRGSLSGGWCLSPAPIGGLWGVLVPSPWEITEDNSSGLRVACGSSSCVCCAAPSCGLGVWCLLAREPPGEWIATTGTSLSASKWTSEEKSLCYLVSVNFIGIDWLIIYCLLPWPYNHPTTLSCIYFHSYLV